MKTSITYTLLSVLPFLGIMTGCQQQAKEANKDTEADKAVFTGQIKNPASDKVLFRLYGKPGNAVEKASINEKDGTFHIAMAMDKPGYLRIKHGDEYTTAFARPGDSLYLKLNPEKFDESLTYKGTASSINNYLAQKILFGEKVNLSGRSKLRSLYGSDPATFKKVVDSVQQAYMQLMKEAIDQKGLAPFPKMERINIKANFERKRMQYPRLYPRLVQGTAKPLPENMKNYTPELPLNDPMLVRVPKYKPIVRRMMRQAQSSHVSSNPHLKDTSQGYITKKVIDSLISNDTVKAQMARLFLEGQIERTSLKALKPLHDYYQAYAFNSVAQQQIDSVMDVKRSLKKGNEAPGFAYPSYDGDTMSLASLKGQYVYIDVWATWCGPCIREIPYLKTLHDTLKNRNVAFVSVSVDRPGAKSKWRSMVKNKDLKGHQLFADGEAFDSKIANDYMIGSIPRFILIGPNGKIIDANAERPSGNIQSRLEKLLKASQKAT